MGVSSKVCKSCNLKCSEAAKKVEKIESRLRKECVHDRDCMLISDSALMNPCLHSLNCSLAEFDLCSRKCFVINRLPYKGFILPKVSVSEAGESLLLAQM